MLFDSTFFKADEIKLISKNHDYIKDKKTVYEYSKSTISNQDSLHTKNSN